MDSIFKRDTKDRCFLCGFYGATEKHHIFGAANRDKSERYGLTVHLCHNCHNEPPTGVHQNRTIADILKRTAQEEWQKAYNKTKEDFIQEFGRNYL